MTTSILLEENACGCADCAGDELSGCLCLTAGLMQIVGRKHSLLVLSLLADHGPVRFNELKNGLGEISSSTLTIRLSELEAAGLIERKGFPEIPPRVEYSLTAEGAALRSGLLSFSRVAARRRPARNV